MTDRNSLYAYAVRALLAISQYAASQFHRVTKAVAMKRRIKYAELFTARRCCEYRCGNSVRPSVTQCTTVEIAYHHTRHGDEIPTGSRPQPTRNKIQVGYETFMTQVANTLTEPCRDLQWPPEVIFSHRKPLQPWIQRVWIVAINIPGVAARTTCAAARFVAAIGPRDHITPTLISLHWLPVRQRITYKLCTTMHSVHYGQAPSYIPEIVTTVTHLPGRAHLRSAKKTKTTTVHVYSLDSVGVRSRCLDLMPGTVFLVSWETSLFPPPSSVT